MPCDLIRSPEQLEADRLAEVEEALAELEAKLAAGDVQVVLSPEGAVCFVGWDVGRAGLADTCTVQLLTDKNSDEFRMALLEAEAMAGTTLDMATVTAGVHSHDGGRTWRSE